MVERAADVLRLRLPGAASRAVGAAVGVPVLVHVPGAGPRFALTVDDGPDPRTTPALLDVLAAHQARATFFLIGERAARHPDLVARIAAGGHELGNHLMQDRPSVRLAPDVFDAQLVRVHELLSPYAPVRWFRPGSGWFTPRMLRSAARLGYGCALGTPGLVAARYPDPVPDGARLGARCRDGAVAVLHEGTASRQGVVEVTRAFLGATTVSGRRSVTLSDLSGDDGK